MSSFLILAVLLIRISFKKASASFRCVLWMLVGVRLIVPVSISSPFGLVPDVDLSMEQDAGQDGLSAERDYGQEGSENVEITGGTGYDREAEMNGGDGIGQLSGENQAGIAGENNQISGGVYPWESGQNAGGNYPLGSDGILGENNPDGNNQFAADGQVPETDAGTGSAYISGDSVNNLDETSDIGEENRQGALTGDETAEDIGENSGNFATYAWNISTYVWLMGSCVLLLYMLISYLHLRNSLKEAIPSYVSCGEVPVKVYRHESVDSPFLLGIISPKIYVPLKMMGQDLQFVLAHERTHLRRRDHWLKPLSFLVLALYWFHPLVWVAYILLGRDIELACDERVIRENPKLDRAAYASALLTGAVKQPKIAVCPVAFGEVDVKQRVNNVLNYKKPGFWIALFCALLGVVVVLLFMTVSEEDDGLPASTEDVQDEEASGDGAQGENQDDSQSGEEATSGEQIPTQERRIKYRMYYDVIHSFDGDEGAQTWDFVTSELPYERDCWFADYNGEKLLRIASEDEQYMASLIPDIVYYKADEGETPLEIVLKMLDAMIEPLTIPSENRSYTIKKYAIRDQKLIQVGDGVWLLPYIDGYYDYEGVDFISMEQRMEVESGLLWNGMFPFEGQGSDSVFYYLLIEENGVFRLQLADDMKELCDEYAVETAGEPENELIFYYPVNSLNAPEYIPPNEHELIAPDCFWAGNGYVFVDDSINGRILVYKDGAYEKSIGLPNGVGMDIQKMYYLQEADELKVVWLDTSTDMPSYYNLAGFDVSSGMLMNGWREEIGDVHEQMTHCCFDSEGVLWRNMLYDKVQEPDEATKRANHIVTLSGAGEFPYAVSEDVKALASYISDSWKIIAKHNETNYYLHNQLVFNGDERLSLAVVMKNNTHVATPEADANPILSLGPAGNIYQMVVDEGGVRIYRLGFAEYDAEDRNDMMVRQIQPAEVTVRSEGAASMAPIEDFKVLDSNQVWEWTKDGKFAELVQAQGMSLFEQYDNLEPSVLYEGAAGASYSCRMDYDGKIYELTVTYEIDKNNPDMKKVQRVYVESAENGRRVVLYSVDESDVIGDFGNYLINSYGVEKQISFCLPAGFNLGAYNKQFAGYYASFLEGDIEEKPGDFYASDWAVTPGGIGTFSGDYLAYDENGEAAGFAHWWTGTGGTWREDECEKLDGCFTSAVLTEFHMSYFRTAPDHGAFMQKYPELSDQYLEPVDYWYVYICDVTMETGYMVFLKQEYFSKEDAIAFARSVKPLENVDMNEEGGGRTELEPTMGLNMKMLLKMAEDNTLIATIEEQGIDWFRQYNNPVGGGPVNTVSSSYAYRLSHQNKEYELRVHFKIGKDGAEDTVDTVYIIYPDTGEKEAIYTVRNNVETVDLGEFVDYIDRAYSLDKYITYQLPEGYNFTLGEFEIPVDEVGPMYNGCLLEGDLEPLPIDGNVGWSAAPGGIGTFTNWKRITFENGEPVAISYGGNHQGVNKDSFEKVEGCFTSALLAELNFDLFSAATYENFKQEHPELADSLQSSSKIWYVLIGDETMDVGYAVFLNQAFFTKEDAIAFARSVKPIEEQN